MQSQEDLRHEVYLTNHRLYQVNRLMNVDHKTLKVVQNALTRSSAGFFLGKLFLSFEVIYA